MKYVKLISLLSLSALLHGCASDSALQLNNPDKAQLGVDLANLLPPREIPYEVQQVGDIQVAYNMFFVKSDNLTGHRLTLAFRNTGKSEIIVTPELLVRDAGGFIYPPYNYAAFVAEAANLAGTQIPQVTIAQQSTYYSSGTGRSQI